jgi:hypothetical protein
MLLPTTRKVLAEVYVIVVGLVHSAGLKSLLPGTLSAGRQNEKLKADGAVGRRPIALRAAADAEQQIYDEVERGGRDGDDVEVVWVQVLL